MQGAISDMMSMCEYTEIPIAVKAYKYYDNGNTKIL